MPETPGEPTWSHAESAGARQAVAALHGLRECVITALVWAEPALELTVVLDYVWTDDGRICFGAGEQPRQVTLHFTGVDELRMVNALTAPMLDALDRLNWGISEIAVLEVSDPSPERPEFATAHFRWEDRRSISVWYRTLTIGLSHRQP